MAWQSPAKKVLSNGLTVLVVPNHQIPKVSAQLWYNVGSKDEKSGQKGIAHLIEHMIFKGTSSLSESDINLITYKLSGQCNAFTSYDFTGYLFDFPSQHWHEALPIMADCMQGCTFKQEFLNSELKAVIQELKMYNDDYVSTLVEKMVSTIFQDHPYHHPVIGYKQDLWNLKRETMVDFYGHHYIPNNSTLIIVGDVAIDDAFAQVEHHFGAILPNPEYRKEQFHHNTDLVSQSITIYRDIQQPIMLMAWVIPGTRERKDYILDTLTWILGSGKGSKLYRKLVDELALATEVEAFAYDLFDHGILFVSVQPKNAQVLPDIEKIIFQELEAIGHGTIDDEELSRAIKKTEVDFLSLNENNQKLAYLLGKYFVATGDETYLSRYCDYPKHSLRQDVQNIVKTYISRSLTNYGKILPMEKEDTSRWVTIQEQSDREDARILGGILRETAVEPGVYVNDITPQEQKPFNYPKAQNFVLSNGLKVFWYHNPHIAKIDMILDFKAKHFYDPERLQGLSMFLADMLQEGTKKYSAQELARAIESYGMTLATFPGQTHMSTLTTDFNKGLEVLYEVMTQAILDPIAIEKVRQRLLTDLANFWDEPSEFIGQLAKEIVYHGHPYSKNMFGTIETINAIKQEDLLKAYKEWITPRGARLSLVGDFTGIDLKKELESIFSKWQGTEVTPPFYPKLSPIKKQECDYPINRDQVVLAYAGLSISRNSPDFDKILLFDQILTGGILGSMSSRLFDLRERSGLFYTIGGSLLARVDDQPGMIFIKTIVSHDRLAEAEKKIEALLNEGAEELSQSEVDEARAAISNSLVDHFASNRQIAGTFLFLDEYGFSDDFFDKRNEQLAHITIQEIQDAVSRLIKSDNLIKLRVGRV